MYSELGKYQKQRNIPRIRSKYGAVYSQGVLGVCDGLCLQFSVMQH